MKCAETSQDKKKKSRNIKSLSKKAAVQRAAGFLLVEIHFRQKTRSGSGGSRAPGLMLTLIYIEVFGLISYKIKAASHFPRRPGLVLLARTGGAP